MKHLAYLLLAACTDAPADDAGGGTGTLVVTGTASATSSIANASDPSSFTTDFTLDVTRAGAPVTTGTVTITSDRGAVALRFDGATMRWHGAQAGYEPSYALDITSDSDAVSGVQVAGPDIQTFTAPLAGATVDSTQPLAIAWARVDAAAIATLGTREINGVSITDTGTYMLATGSLRSKQDQVEDERLELVRAQQVTPAGAAAGSQFRVSVATRIDLLVAPTGKP